MGYVVVRVRLNGKVHKLWGNVGSKRKSMPHLCANFSNLLILNGIIIQLAFWCRYAVNNMHAYVLPTFFNGQTMRANMFAGQFVLFCGTKQPLFFGQKAKPPPPPPGWLTQRG